MQTKCVNAQQLFDSKWPNVQKIVAFWAGKFGLKPHDREEVLQQAGLFLWKQCLRCADPETPEFAINCRTIALAGYSELRRRQMTGKRRMGSKAISLDALDDRDTTLADIIPARETTVKVDGVVLNKTDAELDHYDMYRLYRDGESKVTEVAARHGVTKQAVYGSPWRYGGIRFPDGKWRFPREAEDRPADRRHNALDSGAGRRAG